MASLKPPKPLIVNNDIDMSVEWTDWLELYRHYYVANKLFQEVVEVRNANFYFVLGRDGLKVIKDLNVPEHVKNDLDLITAVLTNRFAPPKNKTYERCMFHRIKQDVNENFEEFLSKLLTQVKKCGYGINEDEFVMDQMVVGINSDKTRQKLWTDDELDLEKAKKICRAEERADKEIKEMHKSVSEMNLDPVEAVKEPKQFNCAKCGSKHEPRNCPAFNKPCFKCDKEGHFAKMCKTKSTETTRVKQKSNSVEKAKAGSSKSVNAIEADLSSTDWDSDEEYWISALTKDSQHIDSPDDQEDGWFETLNVGSKNLNVKLDTGAGCFVLLQNVQSGMVLDVKHNGKGELITYKFHGGANQLFYYDQATEMIHSKLNGFVHLKN